MAEKTADEGRLVCNLWTLILIRLEVNGLQTLGKQIRRESPYPILNLRGRCSAPLIDVIALTSKLGAPVAFQR